MTDPNDTRIRPYEPRDRDALNACIRELQEHEREIEPRMKPADDILGDYLDDLLDQCTEKQGAILVAERGGRVIGYVCVLGAEPNEDSDEIDYTYGYVRDVAVTEACRGSGVGRRLLDAAEDFARKAGAEILRIHVLAGNEGAAGLYASHGFRNRVLEMEKRLE